MPYACGVALSTHADSCSCFKFGKCFFSVDKLFSDTWCIAGSASLAY